MKTLSHHVAEIFSGGTDGVEDAAEIAGRMFVWFEGFFLNIPCCRVRFTLVEILFAVI